MPTSSNPRAASPGWAERAVMHPVCCVRAAIGSARLRQIRCDAEFEVAPLPRQPERRGMVAAIPRLSAPATTSRLGGDLNPADIRGVESDVEEPFMKAKLLACILVVGLSSPVSAAPYYIWWSTRTYECSVVAESPCHGTTPASSPGTRLAINRGRKPLTRSHRLDHAASLDAQQS